jgi:hypothetical protein
LSIEVPSGRAFKAFSVSPSFATCSFSIDQINSDTFSIDNTISFITGFTNSNSSVEIPTLRMYFAANSVFIEIVMVRTLDTDSVVPSFAAKVIIEDFDKFRVLQFIF